MSEEVTDVVVAFEQVKQAVVTLRADYKAVSALIVAAEAELKALPESPVPFEDLKAGILEMIDTAGARYADEYVKPALIDMAVSGQLGFSRTQERHGKPVLFSELEGAIAQSLFPMARTQLIQPSKAQTDDCAFYFFFGDQIKAGLQKIMDTLAPGDFGYDTIHPDKVGSDRATRKAAIADKKAELKALYLRRGELSQQLTQLGANAGYLADDSLKLGLA